VKGTRLLVIGLDCAAPELLFRRFAPRLPNLNGLRERGWWGEVESCIPPITVPAWMVMFTGREPGELGMYGFRNREPGTYNDMRVADSASVRCETLWERAAKDGRRCCLIGVPPSYPPYQVNGDLISCFLTPGTDRPYTYPRGLSVELEEQELTYVPDVPFRVVEKAELLEDLREMTGGHFDIAAYLMQERDWDLFCMVEIGLDRVQHAFWRYQDPSHHLYEEGSPFASALEDYYRLLDSRIGELLEICGPDTAVAVVSDHGAQGMKGAFCINQWLAEKGYLALGGEVERGSRLQDAPVDWSRTRAWGWGGYYARVFLNVEGREPEGVIPPDKYEEEVEALARGDPGDKGTRGRGVEDQGGEAPGGLLPGGGGAAGSHGLPRRPLVAGGGHHGLPLPVPGGERHRAGRCGARLAGGGHLLPPAQGYEASDRQSDRQGLSPHPGAPRHLPGASRARNLGRHNQEV